jgi:hypothetical protein
MSTKPDEYYWRGEGGDGWSRRERPKEPDTGSWHGVGTEGCLEDDEAAASDGRIEEGVKKHLARNAAIDATKLKVHVQNGDVTLLGVVRSLQEKQLCEDTARAVPGVKQVDNKIRVEPVT